MTKKGISRRVKIQDNSGTNDAYKRAKDKKRERKKGKRMKDKEDVKKIEKEKKDDIGERLLNR